MIITYIATFGAVVAAATLDVDAAGADDRVALLNLRHVVAADWRGDGKGQEEPDRGEGELHDRGQ